MKATLFATALVMILHVTHAAEKTVVFDGGENSAGAAWASPKGKAILKLSSKQPYANKQHLEFNAQWVNWYAGCGWNWAGWNDPDGKKALDLSKTTSISLYVKVASGSPGDLMLSLVDTKGKAVELARLVKDGMLQGLPTEYKKVVVPLRAESFRAKGVDMARIWEIRFTIAPTTATGKASIFFDQIALGSQAGPKEDSADEPAAAQGPGAKLGGVHVVDKDYLMVHVIDGEVKFKDDGKGKGAFAAHGHQANQDKVVLYKPGLNPRAAVQPNSWTLNSTDDQNYKGKGKQPSACHRKSKVNGHSEQHWVNNDFHYEYTYEHFIYLKLPHSLKQGKSYSLEIAPGVRTEKKKAAFTFDIYNSHTEALHVNLVGYLPKTTTKAADLYVWMGDGGARDYKAFEGNAVYLYDVASKKSQKVGSVRFWKKAGGDVNNFDLTKSDVWSVDIAKDARHGTYRLAVDGIGCSQDFEIRKDIYRDPFKVSVKGFYYMRIGEKKREDIKPVPRQPRYIPGKDPPDTKVYLTTMHPWHKEWKTFVGGDKWDKPAAWKRFRKPGNPTNPNAWGGHSDALDWDRHLGHVSIIYDMLLPFILTDGALKDDDLGIAESGNGIPDLLDEARNEVDFWLRLRDGKGFSHGLTNPKNNELFQAAPTALAAWASAANAAILADCFRLAGDKKLMTHYRDASIAAYTHAGGHADQMLDKKQGLGDSSMRGRDFKMMAAAFLYNLTGKKEYEDVVKTESICTKPTAEVCSKKFGDQTWATIAYLKTPQKVNHPDLRKNMKASAIHQARNVEAGMCAQRPSRRATRKGTAWFRTSQNVQVSLIAHAVAEAEKDKAFLLQAILQEADYGLGRNPLNMVQMTTATTELADKRSVQGAYTSGRNDGSPGMHPGHTPYMNLFDWNKGMTMAMPSRLTSRCYPANFTKTWPHGEGYFNTRYVYAHNEFTPQQTMRGKMALYAYLYGIGRTK